MSSNDESQSSGRLATLTAFGIAAAAIPVPFVPDRALARVRGAIVHDVVSRHGLSITTDARRLLADPDPPGRTLPVVRKAVEVFTRRVLRTVGPLRMLVPLGRALEAYALGHLLDRYVTRVRVPGPVRIHGEEARTIRDLVDRAVLRALSPALAPAIAHLGTGAEDFRDELTRWFDAVLLTSASLPGYVDRRLEAAFDEVVAESGRQRG